MPDAVDELIEILDLEELEVNIFRGRSPDENRQRVFGGQVAGQALVAAGRTVERGAVHSLHAYFLRPGDPTKPILYEVDRIRDGRTFTTRRVVAIQHGKAIFNLAASFQPDEVGPEHQIDMPGRLTRDAPSGRNAWRMKDACRAGVEWIACDRSRCARSPRATRSARRGARRGSWSGSVPAAGCPMIRCCTSAWSSTRRT
jgi:acyl-CoA thioesterase